MRFSRIITPFLVFVLIVVVAGLPSQPTSARRVTPTPTPTPPTSSGPPAPAPLAPANGAQVTVPFTISWSAVSDPRGIVAYNWQVSPSSTFSPVIQLNSTSGQTQDTVSGLTTGAYFWRVQAVNGNLVQGERSSARNFTVTEANSAAPGAATYNFDASTDPSFPVATRVHFDNIPNTTYSLQMGDSMPQGTWYVRVTAVNGNRRGGGPSHVVT